MDDRTVFADWFTANPTSLIVTVSEVYGSAPREAGTVMAVSQDRICGTIGGGQLEYIAIDHARMLLAGRKSQTRLDIPLGPEIGQCCGGRTVLSFTKADPAAIAAILDAMARRAASDPPVYIFGGGHVGFALAAALAPLPLAVTLVETREEMIAEAPPGIRARLTALPEAEVRQIPAGGAAVILTHDHALDFLIATEALKRDDLAYCGMIGSKTKKATFLHYAAQQGLSRTECGRLILPIGGSEVRDKRPTVIAALVAAELLRAFALKNALKSSNLPGVKASS